MTGRRLLLVHAHPDDESLTGAATIAAAVAAGVSVTLVTCTRGELGEVLPDDLAHLRGDPDGLAAHREGELAAAMAVLGVTDHRFLGAAHGVRYRDSGMVTLPSGLAGTPPDLHAEAFAAADPDDAAGLLADVVREVRPQVAVTYDPTGGYGHPDHVMTHRVAMRAFDMAARGGDGWQVAKVYAPAWPLSLVRGFAAAAAARPDAGPPPFDIDEDLPGMVMPDDVVTTAVDGTAFREAKFDALAAHRSQLVVDREAGTTTQDDGFAVPVLSVEWYALLRGDPAPPFDADGRETGLFHGIPT